MTAKATVTDIEDNQRQNNAFNLLFQGFMGLGLLVGVSFLGAAWYNTKRALFGRKRRRKKAPPAEQPPPEAPPGT